MSRASRPLLTSLTLLCLALAPCAAASDTAPPAAVPRGASRETQLRLEALGYSENATDDPDPSRRGVTRNDPDAMPGVNYYCTNASVRFVAMDGAILHEVPLELAASPGSGCLAELYRDREVVTVGSPLLSMLRLGGQPRWSKLGPYHHDVGIDATGLLYALRRFDSVLTRGDAKLPITGQAIDVLHGKGRAQRSIDLTPMLAPMIPEERVRRIAEAVASRGRIGKEEFAHALDVFHPNTVEVVDWPHAPGGGRRVLIAVRQLDRIMVIDLDERRIVWEWGAGQIVGPHDPWLLPNGNVLLFDNGVRPTQEPAPSVRMFSRVVEVDPRTDRIVWEYRGDPPQSFFSPSRGGAQPLQNGNVLVTETTKGRAFEVTRAGKIVWEYWNPDFHDGARRALYRMHRIGLDEYRALRGWREGNAPAD
ncbi:arylsulfotransferase family protein [Candidatus Binatia bacterium]|nr:arylsulfotransferase family protein [Candidatus Binatia bacterium]